MAKKRTDLEIRSKGGDKVEKDLKDIGATAERSGRKIERASKKASKGLKAVDAAVASTNASMRRLASRLGPVGAALSKLGPAGLAAAGGAVAAGGLLLLTKRAAANADALAKQARAADISVEALQEYRFAAKLAGIATDQLDGSLVKFNKRVGDLTTSGTGPLVSFLEKFDKSLLENIRNARSQEEALDLVFRKMATLESQAERTALADAAFSETGRKMTLVLGDNADALDNARQRARELGLVLSSELTDNAERMNDRLSEMSGILGTNIDRALLTLAPAIESVGLSFANAAPGIAKFVESLLPLESLSLGSLAQRAGELRKKLREARDDQIRAEADPGLFGVDKRNADSEVARLEKELKQADALLAQRVKRGAAEKRLAEERRAQAQKEAAERKKAAEEAAKAEKAEKARASARKRALADIAKLEVKASKAGLTGVALLEKERDEELARQKQRLEAGIILEEEFARARLAIDKDFAAQRAEIERAAQEKIDEERRKLAEQAADELAQPIKNAAENIQREFGDVFTNIFRNGKADSETFFNSMKDLAARTAGEIAAMLVFRPQLLASGGGLAGIFGAGSASASGGAQGVGGVPGLGLLSGVGKGGFINVPGLGPISTSSLALAAQALGAGVIGNRVGEFATGGLGIRRNDGGTVGSVVGGTAGFFLGGPIGAGIGSFLGDVVGNAIGDALGFGKSKVKVQIGTAVDAAAARQAGFNNSRETAFGVVGLTSRSNNFGGGLGNGLTNLLAGIDNGIASLLNQSQIDRVRAGLTGGGVGVTQRISAGKFDNEVFTVAKDRLVTIIDSLANNQVASKLLNSIDAKQENVKPLIDKAGEIIQLIKLFDDPGEPINAAQQAINALNDQFDKLADAAQKLGFSVSEAEQKRADALKSLTDDFETSIRDQILAIEDPLKLALENQEKTAQERLDNARTLGADLVEVERLNAIERQRVLEQVGGFGGITAFLDSLNISAAGGLTVAARASNADTRFSDLLASARTDAAARADLANFLPGFVDLKRQQLGSTEAFFEFKSFLESSLRNLVGSQDTANTLNNIGSAITDGNNAIVVTLQDEIGGLKTEVADLNRKLSLVLNA